MSRKTVLDIGGYNDDFYVLADYELWSNLLQKSYAFQNLREVLVGYMVNADSFGAVHSHGQSIIEASKIIQSNANNFAHCSISLEGASNIYKMLAFNMNGLTLPQVIKCEKLIRKIFNRVGVSKRNSSFVLNMRYVKYVVQLSHKNNEDSLFRYAVKRSLLNGPLLLLFKRFYDEILKRIIYSIIWRNKKNLLQ